MSRTPGRDADSELVHRLKNHLAIIVGFADLLVTECPEGDARAADLAEIQKAARDAMAMMGDLDRLVKK